ncbi:MAG: LacI family transcriptional regulator [Atopostipes suicloacalis]|nr:LacI family transcriptional regulator [Atopostipes suicloacalis]MDN6730550.1 LacI family transcriptional regulator [Atopostipes suicloacalis]
MATIREVAKLAGVSAATVSRVLNESGYVSESSRKKVKQAVKKLDYFPNEVARSLFQKRSNFIGLLLPDITNPFFPALAKGVEDSINNRGYSLLLGNVEDDPEKEKDYLKIFSQNNIAGVITAVQGKNQQLKKIPMVVLDRVDDEQKYSVHSDDYKGGQLAAEAMIERSPKELVVMAGPKEVSGANIRLAGNEKVLQENQMDYKVFQTESYRIDYAEETAQAFFKKFPKADSVIASNDVYAIALMKEAIKRDLKIPEDFQIIGYDDMPFSRMVYPGLSTIVQPAYEIGYQGAELLCDILENKKITEPQIQLTVQTMLRESLRKKDEDEG